MRSWIPLRLGAARLAAARPVVASVAAICGALLLCLVGASSAEAASSHSRIGSHRLCGPTRNAPCRLRTRMHKAVPQPAPYFIRVQRLVHRRQPGGWLERSRPDPLRDIDDAALQDRTVVSGEDDLSRLAALEPLGVLVPRRCPVAASAVIDRHSPRGPPSSGASV